MAAVVTKTGQECTSTSTWIELNPPSPHGAGCEQRAEIIGSEELQLPAALTNVADDSEVQSIIIPARWDI